MIPKFRVKVVYKGEKGQERFTISMPNKLDTDVNLSKLRQYFDNYECENAVWIERGTKSFVKGKSGDKLKIVKIESKSKAVSSLPDIASVYVGDSLKSLISNSGVMQLNSRDFVQQLINYSQSRDNRVVGVSGLRGVGKTTGLLQTCAYLLNTGGIPADKIAYLVIRPDKTVYVNQLCQLVFDKLSDVKYLLIDEVTFVSNLTRDSGMIFNNLAQAKGIKVFMCGTDSLALSLSRNTGLYHRMVVTNITFISYAEAKRTMGVTFKDYIRLGGLYKPDVFDDVEGLQGYISTAVVDNIVNSLTKNNEYSDVSSISLRKYRLSPNKLTKIVFSVLYSIVFSNINFDRVIRAKRVTNLFDWTQTVYSGIDLENLIQSRFNLDKSITVSSKDFSACLDILHKIGLVMRIENLAETGYEYVITNQCVVNVLYYTLVQYLRSETSAETTQKARKSGLKGVLGDLTESLIIANLVSYFSKRLDYKVCYYRDSDGREIDIIIRRDNSDDSLDDNSDLYLFEVKMTNEVDTAVVKTTWLNDADVSNKLKELGVVKGRGILYAGKDTTFSSFSSETYADNIPLDVLERRNKGVKLISIENFVLNPLKYIE